MALDLHNGPGARRVRDRRTRRVFVVTFLGYALVLGLISLGCRWGYFWLLRCPSLAVTDVQVHGLKRLGREEVLATAGVSAGAPLAALDLRRLEDRIKRLAWVERADVSWQWPFSLTVNLREKTPVALIRLDTLYYMDENAGLIKRLSPLEGMDFPVITGIAPPDFNTSRKLLCGRVLPLLAQVDRDAGRTAGLASEISEVQVGAGGQLALYTTDGLLVKLGDRDWQAALREAGRVVSDLRRQDRLREVAAVDASCPMRVFVKFRRGPKLLVAAMARGV